MTEGAGGVAGKDAPGLSPTAMSISIAPPQVDSNVLLVFWRAND
jgi:hypothetical protein